MANDDVLDNDRVRAVLEQWVEGKQGAFAKRFVDALRARGDELSESTINAAFSRAKGGNPDAVKQFFGTPARREAFATAAGRTAAELEAQLVAAPSDLPVVLVVASDVAGGDMNALTRLTKALETAGCAPRVIVDAALRRRLGATESVVLEAWSSKSWLVEMGFNGDGALQRMYEGLGPRRKAWVEGQSLSAGPRWQALRVELRSGGAPTFDPQDFADRLRSTGFVATEPAPPPEQAGDGVALKRTSLRELAAEAGVDVTTEPFTALPLELGSLTGDWHAALIEIARGHAVDAVLSQRKLDGRRAPKVLAALPKAGHHVLWGDGTRAVLSLAHHLGEPCAIGVAAAEQVVSDTRRRVAREAFMKKHPHAVQLDPAEEQLVAGCRARGLAIFHDRGSAYAWDHGSLLFIVEGPGDPPSLSVSKLPDAPREEGVPPTFEATLSLAADRVRERSQGAPPIENPMTELVRAASVATSAVQALYASKAVPADLTGLVEHWDHAERSAAAFAGLRDHHQSALRAIQTAVRRPIGMVAGLWPGVRSNLRIPLGLQHGQEQHSTRLLRLGPIALPLSHVRETNAYGEYFSGSTNSSGHVLAAILWLKAALREGEAVEILEGGGRRVVVTDLRGMVASITTWAVPAGPPVLNAALLLPQKDRKCAKPEEGLAEIKLRYANTVVYPRSLWLGSDDVVMRADFGPPAGLLDWEPMHAAEQAKIAADDAAADDDD